MQESFEPDGYTLQSIISACTGLGALSSGMWVHTYMLRACDGYVGDDALVSDSLVEMYCKCGMLDLAKQVFDGMMKRDNHSWNLMILGFAMHGIAELAPEHFDEMTKARSRIEAEFDHICWHFECM